MTDWYEIIIKDENLFIFQYKKLNRIIPFFSFILFLIFYIFLIINKEKLLLFHHLFFIIILTLSFYLCFLIDSFIFDKEKKILIIRNGLLFFKNEKKFFFDDIQRIIITNFLFKYNKKQRYEIIIELKNGKIYKIGNFKKGEKILKFIEKFKFLIEE